VFSERAACRPEIAAVVAAVQPRGAERDVARLAADRCGYRAKAARCG
jgi:hypothetical protein